MTHNAPVKIHNTTKFFRFAFFRKGVLLNEVKRRVVSNNHNKESEESTQTNTMMKPIVFLALCSKVPLLLATRIAICSVISAFMRFVVQLYYMRIYKVYLHSRSFFWHNRKQDLLNKLKSTNSGSRSSCTLSRLIAPYEKSKNTQTKMCRIYKI